MNAEKKIKRERKKKVRFWISRQTSNDPDWHSASFLYDDDDDDGQWVPLGTYRIGIKAFLVVDVVFYCCFFSLLILSIYEQKKFLFISSFIHMMTSIE